MVSNHCRFLAMSSTSVASPSKRTTESAGRGQAPGWRRRRPSFSRHSPTGSRRPARPFSSHSPRPAASRPF
jgi:hypothetical protein